VKKKPVFLALLLFLGAGSLKSQDIPPPNPGLVINIVSGWSIDFVFDEFSEYQNGISGPSTFIRIGAIYDWKLQFSADQLTFIGNLPGNTMALNNLGVTVVSNGINDEFNGHITNNATVPVGLDYDTYTLLTPGSLTNKGYHHENRFTLNWQMGTMQGTMNGTSMLDQMISGILKADDYTVNVILTLSVYP
jgi:hypothetical protein